jgi:hypothetical protein
MSTLAHSFDRPLLSRQRSNSVPAFSLVNVSAEEASVIFSAAERATARRRRPVSVDSPGPGLFRGYDKDSISPLVFNFSTPSRRGFSGSALKYRVPSIASEPSIHSDDEITPTKDYSKPLPSLPQEHVNQNHISSKDNTDQQSEAPVRPPLDISGLSSPTMPPRRQVQSPTLKAYADGLFHFTQSRLQTAAPSDLRSLGLNLDTLMDESPPPTPELEEEEEEVTEMRTRRPPLSSKFSDWSATTTDTEDDDDSDGYLSSAPASPCTPDMDIGLLSPDSFFNADITPRVAQQTQWTSFSSARPSSGIESAPRSQRSSNPFLTTSSNSTSDSFSYFAGFDSVTDTVETGFSHNDSPIELLQSPFHTPSHTVPPCPNNHDTRSDPTSSVSNSTPLYCAEDDGLFSLSRTPSWLVRAIS